MSYRATIEERGNGLADVGEYVAGDDGGLYRVVRTGSIHTGRAPGCPDWMPAIVEEADWDALPVDAEPYCTAVVEGAA